MRLMLISSIWAPEVSSMGTDPIINTEEQQNELEQVQSYTIDKVTFVVEPRFRTTGCETLGSVLIKLMQNEVDG